MRIPSGTTFLLTGLKVPFLIKPRSPSALVSLKSEGDSVVDHSAFNVVFGLPSGLCGLYGRTQDVRKILQAFGGLVTAISRSTEINVKVPRYSVGLCDTPIPRRELVTSAALPPSHFPSGPKHSSVRILIVCWLALFEIRPSPFRFPRSVRARWQLFGLTLAVEGYHKRGTWRTILRVLPRCL